MKWLALIFVTFVICELAQVSQAGPTPGDQRLRRSPIFGFLGSHRQPFHGPPRGHHYPHGGYFGGGSAAASSAHAASFGYGGGSQSQAGSLASSFGFGPFSASFSASHASASAQSGRDGFFPFF